MNQKNPNTKTFPPNVLDPINKKLPQNTKTKNIKLKILDSKIGSLYPLPKKETEGSAGFDLRACIKQTITLNPGNSELIPSGISIHIGDPNIAAVIIPRSGLGHKHGIILGNTIGLIDSDYQGPLMISCLNRSKKTYVIKPGERIAQLVFIPITQTQFELVKEFKSTARGQQGFGHTGSK